MKTDNIPALVMLSAGAVDCVLAIRNHLNLRDFLIELLIVLVIFYIAGLLIRYIVDRNFKEIELDEEEVKEDGEDSVENINIGDENKVEE